MLSCSSGLFASSDVNKTIVVSFAGIHGCAAQTTANICPLKTKIQSFTDSAHVTLAASASQDASNVGVVFGTDNRAAIQSAIDQNSNTSIGSFALYVPHNIGQGSRASTFDNGCYLIDGTIYLPDSTLSKFRWIRIQGDGDLDSTLCEADVTKDLILAAWPGNTNGTEMWFDSMGFEGAPVGYYSTSAIRLRNMPATRITHNWFSAFAHAIIADPAGSSSANEGSQIIRLIDNTFEFTWEALQWNQATGGNLTTIIQQNVFDWSAFNWALSNNAWVLDLVGLQDFDISHNQFYVGIGRGIKCRNCSGGTIAHNNFELTPMKEGVGTEADYGYQNLSLGGSGSLSGRIEVTGNHFASSNSEAVDILAGNWAVTFHDNSYISPRTQQPYMAISGTNMGLRVYHEYIVGCATPCITVSLGSEGYLKIDDNYFSTNGDGVSVIGGVLPVNSCIAHYSYDVCLPGRPFANLGTAYNGVIVRCSDCIAANLCAGGGSGAIAKGINGIWVCN
jgi:hypothetical protein